MSRWLSILPIKRTKNERLDCGGKDRGMGETEGTGARQRLVSYYKTRLQYGAGRVPGVVPAGAATRLHKGHRERVAGIAGGPRAWLVVDHHSHVGDSQAGSRGGR